MPALKSILVVDDEASIRESLDMFLREKGYAVRTAANGAEGLALWQRQRPQVVILDVRLPDMSGLEVLATIMAEDPLANVIIITAFHDIDSTIAAMRGGAFDYLNKPLDVDELEQTVSRAMRMNEALHGSRALSHPLGEFPPSQRLVGRTTVMRGIFKTVGLLARNRATVLIEGETGTGKELIAQVIHQSSLLGGEPFVTVDCTTLVENLLESELFGHERGAFTGALEAKPGRLELAGEGAIFFDEIGDLPLTLQAKLLRFLEYREFTRVGGTQVLRSAARIIAATNHDCGELVRRGRFRQDLLYRLKVISIRVPPLRERKEDILEMVEYFISRLNPELGTRVTRVEKGALAVLLAHDWPGNVRELRNVLTKALLEARGAVLLTEVVQAALASQPPPSPAPAAPPPAAAAERDRILAALTATGWNYSATARALGISRPTLHKRMLRHGLLVKSPT
ncbi:MAG: sigma-54 dependent transcriptional regulator [Deltaproteobacteria bacterium]|nr:sigma-54 dependent transcriptional regulator [Deltaproteobacteria bacterium]